MCDKFFLSFDPNLIALTYNFSCEITNLIVFAKLRLSQSQNSVEALKCYEDVRA